MARIIAGLKRKDSDYAQRGPATSRHQPAYKRGQTLFVLSTNAGKQPAFL